MNVLPIDEVENMGSSPTINYTIITKRHHRYNFKEACPEAFFSRASPSKRLTQIIFMKSSRSSIYQSSQALFYSRSVRLYCHTNRIERFLTINHNIRSPRTKYRPVKQNVHISSIAKQIRETGQLPSLPTEAVVKLPELPGQRKLRDENIVRDDMQATLEAHYAANVLADGHIHIKLDGTSYSKPRRLAVTPPKERIEEQDPQQISVKATAEDDSLIPESTGLDMHRVAEKPTTTSELKDKLLRSDQSLDASRRLDAEIQIFQSWIELTQDEEDAALDLWARLKQKLFIRFPLHKFELHGSRAAGLARPFSDIDVKFTIPGLEKTDKDRGPSTGRIPNKNQYVKTLFRIKSWIGQENAEGFEAIGPRLGRVPLVELRTRNELNFKVDVSAVIGKPIEHNAEFVKYFMNEYPQIKPLYHLLRWWLEGSGIGNATDGGLSSYLTFNMILTSITHSEQSFDRAELGQQLLHFLRFWSKADWKKLGFAPDPARTFPKFAVNIMPEDIPDKVQSSEDQAYEVSSTNEESSPTNAHEGKPRASQAHATILLSSLNSNDIQSLQLDSSNRSTAMVEDFTMSEDSDQESDVYLQGIKYLTYQANRSRRDPAGRQTYFLLQDPADPRNNIGASFSRFPELCRLMGKALHRLEKNMLNWDQGKSSLSTSRSQGFLLDGLIYAESSYDQDPDLIVQKFEKKRQRLAIVMAKLVR